MLFYYTLPLLVRHKYYWVGSARFIEGGSLSTNLAEFLGGKSEETFISSMLVGNKGLAIAGLLPVEPGFRQCVDSTHGCFIR